MILLFLLMSTVALAQADPKEKARSLVESLRKQDDESVRRDLYALGAPSLAPLARALEKEADPGAWTRLAETFEGVLRARLEEMEKQLSREERERLERAAQGLPISAPAGVTAAAVQALEEEVLASGYAAARELVRPGATRDELSTLARAELFADLLDALSADALAARAAPGKEAAVPAPALAERLARLGPLASPLLAAALSDAKGPDALAEIATRARDLATARCVDLLRSEDAAARAFAEEWLFGLGDLARPALERLVAAGTPDERWRANRLIRRIAWSISEELYRRTGHLLDGFESLSWQDRRFAAYELEKQGRVEAIPALRRILARDPSPDVRVAAAEALARQGDRAGLEFLSTLGLAPLTQSPEILAGIAMDQGIRYLQIHRYERAIKEFERVLEIQPDYEIAHYNLACAYSLRYGRDGKDGDLGRAFEALERSIRFGFDDWRHMLKDGDLASLRGEDDLGTDEAKVARFEALIERLKTRARAVDEAGGGENENENENEGEGER